jgi:hypothetical protein
LLQDRRRRLYNVHFGSRPAEGKEFTMPTNVPGVFAVQCPNPKCRKFMLVEEHDRNKVVPCLLCKTPIRVGGGAAPTQRSSKATPPPRI